MLSILLDWFDKRKNKQMYCPSIPQNDGSTIMGNWRFFAGANRGGFGYLSPAGPSGPSYASVKVDYWMKVTGATGTYLTSGLLSGYKQGGARWKPSFPEGRWVIERSGVFNLYTVGTMANSQFPAPIEISGVQYNDSSDNLALDYWHTGAYEYGFYRDLAATDTPRMSLGAFISFGPTGTSFSTFDHLQILGRGSSFISCNQRDNPGVTGLYIQAHGEGVPGNGQPIFIIPNKTYWITMLYNSGVSGVIRLYDPSTTPWTFSGESSNPITANAVNGVTIGQYGHPIFSPGHTKISDILLDWTECKFPLGPSGLIVN